MLTPADIAALSDEEVAAAIRDSDSKRDALCEFINALRREQTRREENAQFSAKLDAIDPAVRTKLDALTDVAAAAAALKAEVNSG